MITAGVVFFNIFTAEDKTWATGREVTTLGTGFGASMAGGAVAGIWLGPVGMAVGAAIGGVLGAVIGNEAYLEFAGPERQAYAAIITPRTWMFYIDEDGMARDLVRKSGLVMDEVYQIFLELDANYNSDADDVAVRYIELVRRRRGPIEEGLRLHRPLNKLLVKIMTDGWTGRKETAAINFLKNLQRPGLYE